MLSVLTRSCVFLWIKYILIKDINVLNTFAEFQHYIGDMEEVQF